MNILTLIKARLGNRRGRAVSPGELKERNLSAFRRFAAYAAERSPYYAGIVRSRSIDLNACTPEDFPVLTKREAMENFDDIVTDRAITKKRVEEFLSGSRDPLEMLDGRYYVLHTSGSSGEIGYYVYSRDDMARGLSKTPTPPVVGPRRTRLAFFGATGGHFAGVTFSSVFKGSVLRFLYRMRTFEINSPLARVVNGLNSYRPDVVAGYATALKILADKKLEGELKITPVLLMSSGEPVNPRDREVIETAFGAPLYNAYMCTEHVYMGLARPEYSGMYLFEDDLLFELHDDHTCVTNLFNRTMPLIRYRMEDVLTAVPDDTCLLPFTKVREVVGRSEYIPYFTDASGKEDFISPHIINEFFVKGLRRFQMQVVDKGSFVFKVIPEKGITAAAREAMHKEVRTRLAAILADKGLGNVGYDVREVLDLPVDKKTGKFKLILPPAAG